MKFSVKTGNIEKQRAECVILPIFENQRGPFQRQCEGKKGQILLMASESSSSEKTLLVGCGPVKGFNAFVFKDVLNKALTVLFYSGVANAILSLESWTPPGEALAETIRQTILLIQDVTYSFDTFKSQKKSPPLKFNHLTFIQNSQKNVDSFEKAIEQGMAISEGMAWSKNLANMPPNICTPSYLAEEAKRLVKKLPKTSVAILEKKDLEALKMGSLLSVAQGSIHPPKLITLSYRGARKSQKPIVLVGKGITFDTGGNSIKPANNMISMKHDMTGAASIYGVFKAVEKLQLPIHLIGIIPTCENMPGPYASRPDDVVTSMSGQTIEILNTDAEGRLILADALTYCERFDPEVVIDIATLTGACIIALGHYYSGIMGNNDKLIRELCQAGKKIGDPAWELPLGEEYTQCLQSETADIANIAGPDVGAGSIIGGSFLSKFTQKYPWAHLDIAGTARHFSTLKRGSSGRPVPLLVQYLIHFSETH